jgi:hypothetical protein
MLRRSVSDPVLSGPISNMIREMRLFGHFKPIIYYMEGLEVVQVFISDVNYVETHLTDKHYLAVFERSHNTRYGQEHFVGFNLWAVSGVCNLMGIEPVGKLSMCRILRFLREYDEDKFVQDAITNIMLPMLEDHNLDEFEIST